MATVLAISSEVVRGYVGNSAVRRALQAMGHEVWALASIILSNHPGHAQCAGERIPPETLTGMLNALRANGWLRDVDAVFSGYLPSAAYVAVVNDLVRELRTERPVRYLCDPILGDDPKGIYIDAAAAEATRDQLLPIADVITPNRFELAWLSGHDVTGPKDALAAARALQVPTVLATSIPGQTAATLTNLCIDTASAADQSPGYYIDVPLIEEAPNGTGDLLAALYLGHSLNGRSSETAFATAVAGVDTAIKQSAGTDELRLSASRVWLDAEPLPTSRIDPMPAMS